MYSVDNYNWTRTSTYTWKLDGPLAGGASAGIILVYNATNAGTMISNTAVVHSDVGPVNMSTNYTNVSGWSLQIKKDTLDANVSVGDQVKFLITVTNTGEGPCNNVYIEDSGYNSYALTYLNWYNAGYYNWTKTSSGTWKLNGPLPGGASAGIVVVFNATSPYTMASNTAYVHSDYGGSNSSTNFTNIQVILYKFKKLL